MGLGKLVKGVSDFVTGAAPAIGTAIGGIYGGPTGAMAGMQAGNAVAGQKGPSLTAQSIAAGGVPGAGVFDFGSMLGGSSGSTPWWASILGPLITGGTGLIGGIMQSDLAEEQLQKELDQQNMNQLLALQLEALKAKYLQPANPTPYWAPGQLGLPDRITATQNAGNSKINQLNSIVGAYNSALR